MAKWTEIDIYTGLVKNVDEDAPANFAGQGSKVALPPDAQMKKKKKLIDARTKVYRQHRERLEKLRAQREAKRKSMKEHKGTTPHKHPHEDELDEALSPQDKKVVDAFYKRKSMDGKILSITDKRGNGYGPSKENGPYFKIRYRYADTYDPRFVASI